MKSRKIIMMHGISGSGKSTWIKENIIEKDLIFDKLEHQMKYDYIENILNKENMNAIHHRDTSMFLKTYVKYIFDKIIDKYIQNRTETSNKDKQDKFLILSADDIRTALHGKYFIPYLEPFVFCIRQYILMYLIEQKFNFVLDETNIWRSHRKEFFKTLDKFDKDKIYDVECVSVYTDLEEAKDRAMKKYGSSQHVSAQYIYVISEHPIIEEGFSQIKVI